MCHPDETLSAVGEGRGFWSRVEGRRKTAVTLGALVVGLLAPGYPVPFLLAGIAAAGMLSAGMSPKGLAGKMAYPALTGLLVLSMQLLVNGSTPLLSFHLVRWQATVYREGWEAGLTVMGRVLAGSSWMLLWAFTTPLHQVVEAARWLRIPSPLLDLCLMVYRYLHVLGEEAARLQAASRVRMGRSGWRQAARSTAVLAGIILIRAYDRAERAYWSMQVRGYGSR